MNKKIILGFSGGVDSSASAFLLQRAGYEVIAVQLLIDDNQHENMDFASRAAERLGIKLIFDYCEADFRKNVLEPFIDDYKKGVTPSPCPLCNAVFKFERLAKIAEREGIEKIATGHYAALQDADDGLHYIRRWNATFKDQSYMLYRLSPQLLRHTVFPLSCFKNKEEVRNVAREIGLVTANRKDSQGLCFAPNGIMKFLENNGVEFQSGMITDNTGKVLGNHDGYPLYTIGQRRGLGLKENKPLFVTQIIRDENRIVVGDYGELYNDRISVKQLILHGKYKHKENQKNLTARLRSSAGFVPVENIENDCIILKDATPWAAAGQHLVLYDGNGDENSVVAGGGIIV